MSADAPVYNEFLSSVTDVDLLVGKLRRHRPDPDSGRVLQAMLFWHEAGAELSQKNLARAWNGIIAKHVGYSPGEMWELLCREFIGEVEITNPRTGAGVVVARSSETLRTKAEWTKFLDDIKRCARDHYQIELPSPQDPAAWSAFRGTKRLTTARKSPR